MSGTGYRVRWGRAMLSGVVGGLVWCVALAAIFGPAQAILSNPRWQHPKLLQVFGTLEPLPRTSSQIWLLPLGLMAVSLGFGFAYALVSPALPAGDRRRGMRFGLVAWLLMAPWFEFYLPWNVLHEPAVLVLFELALWLIVMQAVGLSIALTYRYRPS